MSRELIPNLFFIGGMRCGSTSIHLLLDQHPEIYMSAVKEPRFFEAELMRRNIELANGDLSSDTAYQNFVSGGKHRIKKDYLKLFENAREVKYLGESSHYLYTPETAEVIKQYSKEAHILICLRDPVNRLFSEYQLFKRRGKEIQNFRNFLEQNARIENGKLIELKNGRLNKGLYYERVLHFINVFGKEKVKVVLFEDFTKNEKEVINEVFTWLNIETDQKVSIVHTQQSGEVKNNPLYKFLINNKKIKRLFRNVVPKLLKEKMRAKLYNVALKKEEIDDYSKQMLLTYYAEDKYLLKTHLGLEISSWQ